ncbi:hypothetical protein I4F81_011268 [Pyropia yezoensis]|uniref:Uncharacterized protein n=1 Tax=Pyropia yezoensis TaxID=2788 RepID=A0ACC3CEZ5_PYRYE|nr:hypothetical protein I4F81_011268 [Neopyropia yezoensis]
MCAAVAAERRNLSSVMNAARRQAELCVYALLFSSLRSGTDGLVARGLADQLSALEEDVWQLLQFRCYCRRRRPAFGFQGQPPFAVKKHLLELRGELMLLLQLAALQLHEVGLADDTSTSSPSAATKPFAVVELYNEAAAAGNALATSNLGVCYERGLGVAKDEKRAVELFQEAAAAGDAGANRHLGVCYERGLGVAKDENRAVELFQKAVAGGDLAGKIHLGVCYERGLMVAKDVKRALKLYQEAAEGGDAAGKRHLGYCFRQGLGVAKDEKRAVELFQEAAAAGDAGANRHLGVCYERGLGWPRTRSGR